MGIIKVLDKDIVGKIAAGEVVERPASVVKELLENALDAGARKILIDVTEGGKSLIRVEDDGMGIAEDDMTILAQHHSTSKLSSAEDLFSIISFGFRGEALSSIAAVSELTIRSRTANSIAGTKLIIKDGDRMIEPTACPKGTIVEVKSLFYNTPARKKYLKSIEHELREIEDIITRYALCFPEVFFKLTHGGTTLINSPATSNTISNISNIYGNSIAKGLLQVDFVQSGIEVMGSISKPSLTKPNRDTQSIFINRRYIKSRTIMDSIEDAYHTLLTVGRHPIAILNITIEPGEIDVNVHPTKREIKFSHENQVYDAVYNAIKKTLSDNELIKEIELPGTKQDVLIAKQEMPKRGKQPGSAGAKDAEGAKDAKIYAPEKAEQLMLKEAEPVIKKRNLPEMRISGQLLRTYIVAEGEDCIYLIDQHAAQERVNYEKFMKQLDADAVDTQALLKPLVIELEPKLHTLVMGNLEVLKKLGFEIEDFGTSSIIVKSFPIIIPKQDRQLILDLIDELEDARNKITEEKEKLLIMRACKASVKANQHLSLFEISTILEDLSGTESPYTCPHGRPVIIRLTKYELEKMFKRK
jgi:DNA mismatch repair protein MutL